MRVYSERLFWYMGSIFIEMESYLNFAGSMDQRKCISLCFVIAYDGRHSWTFYNTWWSTVTQTTFVGTRMGGQSTSCSYIPPAEWRWDDSFLKLDCRWGHQTHHLESQQDFHQGQRYFLCDYRHQGLGSLRVPCHLQCQSLGRWRSNQTLVSQEKCVQYHSKRRVR